MAMGVLRPIFLTGDLSLSPLERSAGKTVRVKKSAEDTEQDFIQDAMKNMIFSSGCGSWYADERTGRVTAVNPSFQTTVAVRSKFPYFKDYDYRGMTQTQAWRSWTLIARIGSILRLGATPNVKPKHYNILQQLLLLPWWLLKYLSYRTSITLLKMLTWFFDFVFPYTRPQPLKGKDLLA